MVGYLPSKRKSDLSDLSYQKYNQWNLWVIASCRFLDEIYSVDLYEQFRWRRISSRTISTLTYRSEMSKYPQLFQFQFHHTNFR